jgi:hypothetical protein
MTVPQISVKPIEVAEGSGVNFGAEISNVDIENLTGMQLTPSNVNTV